MKLKVTHSKAVSDLTLKTSLTGAQWVSYGPKNNYPDILLDLYKKANLHRAIVNLKVFGVRGKGLATDSPELQAFIKKINGNELLYRMATDYSIFGGINVEVVWDQGHVLDRPNLIADVNHKDFSRMRSGKRGQFGQPEHFYYKDDWALGRDMVRFNAFDPMKAADEPRQIISFRKYEPGLANEYYPEPSYLAGVTDMLTEYELQLFRNASAKNSFAPTVAVTINDQLSEEEQNEVEKMLKQNTGSANSGGFVLFFTDGKKEHAPEFKPLMLEQNDGMFEKTTQEVMQGICTAHNLSSPVLAGYPGAGTLGGNGSEIEAAAKDFDFHVLAPMRADIESVFRQIFDHAGFGGVEFRIEPNTLVLTEQQNSPTI